MASAFGGIRKALVDRSEERRVGKECRSRWWAYRYKKRDGRGPGDNQDERVEGRREVHGAQGTGGQGLTGHGHEERKNEGQRGRADADVTTRLTIATPS